MATAKKSGQEAGGPSPLDEVRISMIKRLRSRRAEIEDAVVERIHHFAADAGGCEHKNGQRTTVEAILEYALISIEHADEQTQAIPPEVLAHAHRAARSQIGLGTLLRCYTAGYVLLENFLLEEAESGDLPTHGAALRSVQMTQALLFDDLIVALSMEYAREAQRVSRSPQERRAERIRRLLAGETLDTEQIGYQMDAWHIGIIGTGARVGQAIRSLTVSLDCRLLHVSHDEENVWAWLGGQSKQRVVDDVKRLLSTKWPAGVSLALGEPAEGLKGWRLTHWQAQNAWLVSLHQPQRFTHYANVALLAPWLRDAACARWLTDAYLSPLDGQKVSGETLRQTLRAYFATGRNASAAASALKVSRRTMRNRMRIIEQALGANLVERQAELELALRLEGLVTTHEHG